MDVPNLTAVDEAVELIALQILPGRLLVEANLERSADAVVAAVVAGAERRAAQKVLLRQQERIGGELTGYGEFG